MYVNGKLVWGEEPDGTKAVPLADIGGTSNTEPKQTTAPPVVTTEPPVITTEPVSTTTVSETTPELTTSEKQSGGESSFLYGDADCSGKVDVSDAVLVAKFVNQDQTANITDQGLKNADCDGENGVSGGDVTRILLLIAKIVTADQMGKTI